MAGYGTLLWGGRRWIVAAILLFAAGSLMGFVAASTQPALVTEQMRPLLGTLREIAERVAQSGSPLERTWIIFQYNVGSVLRMLAGGVVFGVLPALVSLANGMTIGIITGLGSQLSPLAGSPGLLALSLAPHAVFELPALWLASAWGMKLGLAWLQPGAEGQRAQVFRASVLEAAQVFALAVVLLFVAAAVEANVTPGLVRWVRS